jgi:hypothetical protein
VTARDVSKAPQHCRDRQTERQSHLQPHTQHSSISQSIT